VAIDRDEIVTATRYRLTKIGIEEAASGVYDFVVDSWIPAAVKRLVRKLMDTGDGAKIHYLVKEFTNVTLSSGVADLTGSTYDVLLLEGWMEFFDVKHSSNSFSMIALPSLAHLRTRQPFQNLFLHYTLEGRKIHTKDASGSLTGLTGSLTINAPAEPTVTTNASGTGTVDLHPALLGDLIDELVEMYHQMGNAQVAKDDAERV
jgi:hypothetical protein